MLLSNDLAALLGFACEATLWGIYSVLFLIASGLLLRLTKTRSLNVPIFVANLVLFTSCTAHFALEFTHFYSVLSTTGVDGYADETMTLVGADILISVSDFLGDLILLYRCWVIWGKNYWVILLPLLTATTGFACMMAVAHLVLTLDPTSPVAPAALVPLGTAGYTLPLATNLMATVLIVAKLWLTARSADRAVGSRIQGSVRAAWQRAVAIIVESGALYLLAQAVFVVLFALGHPAQAILAVVAVQIYGIAPTLIIIRVALGISSDYTGPPLKSASVNDFANDYDVSGGGGIPPRPSFVPALHSLSHSRGGRTEDSGRTLQSGGDEFFEMKSLDIHFDGFAVAV